MKLLFSPAPEFVRDADTQWVYGRWGKHNDVPPGEPSEFFTLRGTLASCIEDIEEVLRREEEANPR